jgi:hypothetical protein
MRELKHLEEYRNTTGDGGEIRGHRVEVSGTYLGIERSDTTRESVYKSASREIRLDYFD